MTLKPDSKDPREEVRPLEKTTAAEAHFREPARPQAAEGPRAGAPSLPRGGLEEASRRPSRSGESLLWNRAAGSAAVEAPPRERRFPSLRAETGAALERELLLVDTPGEETVPPRLRRRLGALVAGAVLLALVVTAVVFFVQVRGHWRDQLGAAQAELEQARKDHGEREQGWKREAAGLLRDIEERKTENRNLSQIADKTLVELKTALDDLRRSREENRQLEAELRDTLAKRSGGLVEILKRYSSLLVPPARGGDPPDSR